MHRPSGGTISNLWLNGHGYFQASSQTIYKRWEPMSFPEIPTPLPLTPRIEFESPLGSFTNLYEFDTQMTSAEQNGIYTVTAFGELKNSKQQEGGIAYSLKHQITDSGIGKEIELIYHDAKQPVRIIEPIIYYPGMTFTQTDDKTVRINTGNKLIELKITTNNAFLTLGTDEEKYKWSYPALKAYPIILTIDCNPDDLRKTVKFSYQVIQ